MRRKSLSTARQNCVPRLAQCVSLLLLILVFLSSPPAATAQGAQEAFLLKHEPGGALTGTGTPPEAIRPFLSALAGKYPGREWRVHTQMGYANHIAPVQAVPMGGATPKAFARQFLTEFSALFGIQPGKAVEAFETAMKKDTLVQYRQFHGNVPVMNSYISFTYRDGAFSGASARVYPDIEAHIPDTTPAVSGASSCDIALSEANFRVKTSDFLECTEPALIIVPREYTTANNAGGEFFLAWKLSIQAKEPLFSETYFIDAATGKILNHYSNIVSQAGCGVRGNVQGKIHPRRATDLVETRPFENLRVILHDSTIHNYTVTDSNGDYSSADCAYEVSFQLQGYDPRNFAKVVDCNSGINCNDLLNSELITYAPVVNYTWNPGTDDLKETTVFWHLNAIHDFFADLAGTDLLNYQTVGNVDYVGTGVCDTVGNINAFYSGDKKNIYFCSSDVSLDSAAVYHEYTHNVVHHIPDYDLPYQDETGTLNEGFSDYFAAAKAKDPVNLWRNITNVVRYDDRCWGDYKMKTRSGCAWNPSFSCRSTQFWVRVSAPDDCLNDYGYVHDNSVAVSGALWDLRMNRGMNPDDVDYLVMRTIREKKPKSIPGLLDALEKTDSLHSREIQQSFAGRGVGADLIENSLTVPLSGPVAAGTSFSVMDTVENRGFVPAGASTTRYYLSKYTTKGHGEILLTGSRAVPPISARELVNGANGAIDSGTATVTVPAGTPAGSYYVLACADDADAVIETDETNNCIVSSGMVQVAGPDLVETAVSNPPAGVAPGASFDVTDTVTNQGALPVNVASTTRYYLSTMPGARLRDILLSGTRSVPPLAPRATSTGKVTLTVPNGTKPDSYYLMVCADDLGAVTESDEANNCNIAATRVRIGYSDLVEISVSDPPRGPLAPGTGFPVTDSTGNQGMVPAPPSTTRYYLSAQQAKGSADILLSGTRSVDAVPPGAFIMGGATVTIPAGAAPGIYYLAACADDLKEVPESNESNNCSFSGRVVQIAAP
ncbi:MAG TPA: CARDB domain-containing protein, partial [Thermodesulfobacteriota bacterium]|nr:CARDB domain-containing protein [Thermodesulfobacteriota bacterium]